LGTISRGENTYITIHETSQGLGFASDDRTIEYYYNSLLNPPPGREHIGYHFIVDDLQVVQLIPINIRSAHAGSSEGNDSIGIERVVNRFVDFPRAIQNQAKITATLIHMYGIPIENVVPHKYWSGKDCPSRLLAGQYGGWDHFISLVDNFCQLGDIFTPSKII